MNNSQILGNAIFDISGNGINLGELPGIDPPPNDQVKDITIANNYITRVGRDYANAQGILAEFVRDVTIEHNEIHAFGFSGMQVGQQTHGHFETGMQDNLIRFNHVYNVARLLDDAGGIYTLGRQRGTTIFENWVHNIRRGIYAGNFSFAAIYQDNYSEFITVDRNDLHDNDRDIYEQAGIGARNNTYTQTPIRDQSIRDNAGLQPAYADIREADPNISLTVPLPVFSALRVEAEDMQLEGATVETSDIYAGGGKGMRTSKPDDNIGAGEYRFDGASGIYNIKVAYLLEDDGQSTHRLFVGDAEVSHWQAALSSGGFQAAIRIDRNITVNKGDVIKITSTQTDGSHGRMDYVELVPVVPVFSDLRVEAEDMAIERATVESNALYAGGEAVRPDGPGGNVGSARYRFDGISGAYNVTVAHILENDGQAEHTLQVDNVTVDTWTAAAITGGFQVATRVINGVSINTGDEIRITGKVNRGSHGRMDYISLAPVSLAPGELTGNTDFTIAENSPVDTEVDGDAPTVVNFPKEGGPGWSIVTENTPFKIDATTGKLSVAGPVRIEAEDMRLEGATVETSGIYAGGGKGMRTSRPDGNIGAGEYRFDGASGIYNIEVAYLLEDDGQSTHGLFVGNTEISRWQAALSSGGFQPASRVDRNITVNKGDVIRITSTQTDGSHGRMDYVELTPLLDHETTARYTPVLMLTRGDTTAEITVTIMVTDVDEAPVANAGPDQVVRPGGTVTLDAGGSSDPEGPVTWQWTQTGGPPVTIADRFAEVTTFTAPVVPMQTISIELRVVDSSGNVQFDTVDVRVVLDTIPSLAGAALPGRNYTRTNGIPVTTLPAADGGNAPVTYTLTGLPGGLSFNGNSRQLRGAPNSVNAPGGATVTYRAMDVDGDFDERTFTITVFERLSFSRKSGDPLEFTVGEPVNVELPIVIGGAPPLRYFFQQAVFGPGASDPKPLPPGLTLDAATGVISGTPTHPADPQLFILNVEDSAEVADRANNRIVQAGHRPHSLARPYLLAIPIEVVLPTDSSPTFGSQGHLPTIGDLPYALNQPFTPVTLPEALGGNPPLRYSIDPPLPAGLTLDPDTRVLSGTPTEAALDTEYTWQVTDTDPESIQPSETGEPLTFRFVLSGRPVAVAGDAQIIFGDVGGLVEFTLDGSGADPEDAELTYRWEQTGGPTQGTIILDRKNPKTRVRVVVRDEPFELQFALTVHDGLQASLPATVTITVRGNSRPRFEVDSFDTGPEYTLGLPIDPITLPEASGGDGALIYTLAPLPPGLTFNADPAVRQLSGTPAAPPGRFRAAYRVVDSDGNTDVADSDQIIVLITTVTDPGVVSFIDPAPAPQTWKVGEAIPTLTLPTGRGLDLPISHALTPDLPAGLTFDSGFFALTVSGTPLAPLETTTYTYTATDKSGDTAELQFTVTVTPGSAESTVDDTRILARQYLQTPSTSVNETALHIVNASAEPQRFTGSLYAGSGALLGEADQSLGMAVAPNGRLILDAGDLETIFGVPPWHGPAMLEVAGTTGFSLMSRLTSPSGLVSNTNCVREGNVLNVEGFDSPDRTHVRFINVTDEALGEVRGTLYDRQGAIIGTRNALLLASVAPKAQVWLNRDDLARLVGVSTWTGEAMLIVTGRFPQTAEGSSQNPAEGSSQTPAEGSSQTPAEGSSQTPAEGSALKLLNLNLVADTGAGTFFNFSCFEDAVRTEGSESDSNGGWYGRVYLQTTSTGQNASLTHLVNTSALRQKFTGTLYAASGAQLGPASQPLHEGMVGGNGRLILSSADLEGIFGISPWRGSAMLEVRGSEDFALMTKRTSPSGRVSNVNCVRRGQVHNILGTDSAVRTLVRFINVGDAALNNIRGTLYNGAGEVVGSPDLVLLASLAPRVQAWLDRDDLASLAGDTWQGTASLRLDPAPEALQLMNLNLVNNETYFNFSCYEEAP